MYNQVLFYNHFGAGDVFESREFVKMWMKLVPANRYIYSHGKHPRILLDIPELVFHPITVHMNPLRDVWDDLNGNLYVNTWIGRNGKYVLPGIGCTVEKLYEMHNDMMHLHKIGTLPGTPIDYIPDINYTTYKIDSIDQFIESHPGNKVYIDNGLVQSRQAENFPFSNIIITIAQRNKDKYFITSQPILHNLENLFSAKDIIKSEELGFDLNEISYISTFCSTLIGRNSGPHVFSQVKKNCMNPDKKLLSFTFTQQGSSFVVNSNVMIRKFWSSDIREDQVLEKIHQIINL